MNGNTTPTLHHHASNVRFARKALIISLFSTLAACGGSNSGYSAGDATPQPVPDQTQDEVIDTPAAPEPAAFTPGVTQATAIGTVLVGANGLTLYTFENDRADVDGDGAGDSDCNGNCEAAWPPLTATEADTASGAFTLITRDDGVTRQWAYHGMPLYFFNGDVDASDTTGEGINDTWFVARPSPFAATSTALGTVIGSATTVNGGGTAADRLDLIGRSLYVFDNDATDKDGDGLGDSDCNGGCAATWPPLLADRGASAYGNYSLITRDDGNQQWAVNGEPLYFFSGDSAAGEVNGDQVGGVWHAARKAPVQLFTAASGDVVFAARGLIADVAGGVQATTQSDRTGFTLYLFDDDLNDVDGDGADSDCNGGCASTWPPLYATATDQNFGDFTLIDRGDGSRQWVYRGAPLYFFVGDQSTGTLNGVYGTWHAVNP